ncbi:MAG: nucleotidyltransferase domain-containing protein [bacterium]|nr:nucleotidyltransferase domain-containing protein [bacterium]
MIDALMPKVRRDILALLLSRPDEAFYQREVVRATQGGKGAVERELRRLSNAGIVLREKRGNQTYYRANQDCPIYPELHRLMVKTAGIADVVREALSQVQGIRLAFIFGSMAKGGGDTKSDVDVLIVGDASFADISGALLPAQERLAREITPTVYTPDEFAERLKGKHRFLMRVLQEPKIMLIGAPDDLERMGELAPE